jgi:phospholipid/cholesterol/gamma-HCH transport system permease protein
MLTVLLDATALLGGLVTEQIAGSLSPQTYGTKSLEFLWLRDIVPATLKTGFFGFLIGTIGCWTGMTSGRSTEEVGQAATRGVVRSTLAVFFFNVLIVPLLHAGVDIIGWYS